MAIDKDITTSAIATLSSTDKFIVNNVSLETVQCSASGVVDAVTKKHTHLNKAALDAIADGAIVNLQLQIDNLTYISPVISGVSVSPSIVEIGINNFSYTITGNINKTNDANTILTSTGLTLVWNTTSNFSLSKSVVSQLLSDQSHTINFNHTFNLIVHSTSYMATLYVRNKRWWGASAGTSIVGSISVLVNNEFSTGYTQSKTFDATGGKYLYFSFPATFTGTPVFKVSGLVAPFNEQALNSNTNGQGYISNYRVFRSTNLQNGSSITVDVS